LLGEIDGYLVLRAAVELVVYQIPDNRICTISDGSSQFQLLLIARSLGLDVHFDD
jgi:hypothetical protein